jgi:hypothetical protein
MRAYSQDLREPVMMDVDAGMKIREISDKYRVTTKWIGDLRKLRAATGSLEPRHGNPTLADVANNVVPSRCGTAGHVQNYHPNGGTRGGPTGPLLDRDLLRQQHLNGGDQ